MAVLWPPSWINEKSIKILTNLLLQNCWSDLVQIWYLASSQQVVQSYRADCQKWPYFGRHLGFTKKRQNLKKSSSPEPLFGFSSNLGFSIYGMSSTKWQSGLSNMAVLWPPSWINQKSIKILKNILLRNCLSDLVQIWYLPSTQ